MKFSNNTLSSGKLSFILLAISLLIGFYFNEDASGGGKGDFFNTWGYNIALQENLLVDPTPWTVHFPLHHIILSRLNFFITDQYYLRLFLCILSIVVPFLFYLNLKTKFNSINQNLLLFLASLIFLLPSFRYSAIWANNHITASIFFLLSTLFFLKWETKKNYNKIDLNIILQTFFLSLAVYTRQYYALIFVYFMIVYFQKLNFINFIKISFIVFVFSLPGFWLILNQQRFLTVTFSNKLFNSLLINSSIMSFYLAPIFLLLLFDNKKLFSDKKKFFIITAIFSTLFVYALSIPFDYNHKMGGGFILKLSVLLFDNNLLFYLSSIFGFIFLTYLSLESKNNFILIIILLLGFSAFMIFQKYFEPTFLFIFFLLFYSKLSFNFLNNYKNLFYMYFYVLVYLISAIINDIYQITKNFL